MAKDYREKVSEVLEISAPMPPLTAMATAAAVLRGMGRIGNTRVYVSTELERIHSEEQPRKRKQMNVELKAATFGVVANPTVFVVGIADASRDWTKLRVAITSYELQQVKLMFFVLSEDVGHIKAYRRCLDALATEFEGRGATTIRGHLDEAPMPMFVRQL